METYESNATTAATPNEREAEEGRSGWLRKNWIRALMFVTILAAVPAYVMLQPQKCQPSTDEFDGQSLEARIVEAEPAMAMAVESSCSDNQPPAWWTSNKDCDEIVRNGQCWWAVSETHNLCRRSCGMCRDNYGTCDDVQPPQWWLQKTCTEIVSRGDCWWATASPLNLCRQSCGACGSSDQCTDVQPPSHWVPAMNCADIASNAFYDKTQCEWASLAPHNLCRRTCGRCQSSMCPQAGCSRGVESGSMGVVLQPTIYYQEKNTLNKHIVRIPAGSVNINIKSDSDWPTHDWNWGNVHSGQDLDLCIRDEEHPHCRSLAQPCRNYGQERCSYLNDCVVGTACGRFVSDNGGTGNYLGMQITYSGDDNINGDYTHNSVNNEGYETVTIAGPTTKDLWVDVSSDRFAKGTVTWSWENCDGSCTGRAPTNKPTPEPTPSPVDCDDVPPPAYWVQNTCQDIIDTRACQWAAYEPRNICRATCGVCQMNNGWPTTNWMVADELVAPLDNDEGDSLVAPAQASDDDDAAIAPVDVSAIAPADDSATPADDPATPARRRLLAEKCEPKYPLWPGLLILGSAAIFVAVVPTKWMSRNKEDEAKDDWESEDSDPEITSVPAAPTLHDLRKISSSGELVAKGRQASLPKIVSPGRRPPAPPTRRAKDGKDGKWSF